ncbi:protein MOR1 isoform X1, partial [Tanacetum coccineum]
MRQNPKGSGMIDWNETLIPMDPGIRLTKITEGTMVNSTEYQSLIGSLRYMLHTRPDLSYSVGLLSRFMQKPREQHMKAIRQVLCYVKGTKDYGITYKHNGGNKIYEYQRNSLNSYLFLICFCNDYEQTYRVGARENDLHMLKTLLYELCKLRGTAITGHLSMVPIDMEPQPIILAYIDLNLQTLVAVRMLTPTRPTVQTQWGDSMANNPMPAAHSVGPQLKLKKPDVMPALLSVVEAECEKNPFEGAAAAPKKTVMASDSVSFVFGGGLDSLPCEHNSRKITLELLKGLECSDWKVNEHCTISHIVDYAQMRLESIEAVNKIVEEANKRIQPTGTVELFGALRARLYDSNHNLFMATLTSISGLEYAMGPAIEKSSMGIVSDIVQYITPSMTPMTDAKLGADGRTDLFDSLSKQLAIQLRPKIGMSNQLSKQLVMKNVSDIQGPALAIVLERLKSHGVFPEVHDKTRATRTGPTVKTTSKIRKSNWLSKQLAIQLLRPVAVAMTDKSADVCKAAEGFFGDIVRVKKNVRDIHGLALAIVLERLNSHGAFPECVEGMEVVCKEFETTSKVPQGHSVDNLITEFHSCLAAKVSKTFDIRLMGASSKSCEYVLSTLMQVFEDKRFAHAVKKRTLDNLITEILLWLLDERVPRMHDGSQLLKVLNVLMLRILLRGTAIKGHLSMVPIDMEPQPIILAYIDLNLQTLAAARMLTPTRPTGQTQWGNSMANNSMRAAHSVGPQLRFVSFLNFKRGVSAKGSKAESIMFVQDKSGPVGSRLAFTPTEPQRESHLMPQPSVIGPTDSNEATPTVSHCFRTFTVSRLHSYPDHITPIAREIQAPCIISVDGMKVICHEFEAISKDLEVHLVDDQITDADSLVSCLAAKVLQKYRLLLLKYLLVMAWRSTILILLLEFIHSKLKKGFNHVEAKGFEFLAPTTRRNSMRVLQAMQLKKP